MGKASKGKSARRAGNGPSRTEIESRVRQEQVRRRLAAALSQPGQLGDALRQVAAQSAAAQSAADDDATGLWGGVTPVPAEIPAWADGSLGDFFFTEPVIARAASAPPAAAAVLPPAERMLAYGSAREAVAWVLIRAVVFDGLPAAGPAIGGVVDRLAPVIEWEAGHFGRPVSDAEAEEIVTGPAFVTGSALVEAVRAVIAEDRIAPVTQFLEPVIDAALLPLALPAELTGAAVARALACAAAHAYTFTDPEDTALLNRLDPDSTTSENPLETLVTGQLLAPRDALLAGLAVLAALAGLCRTNAASALPATRRAADDSQAEVGERHPFVMDDSSDLSERERLTAAPPAVPGGVPGGTRGAARSESGRTRPARAVPGACLRTTAARGAPARNQPAPRSPAPAAARSPRHRRRDRPPTGAARWPRADGGGR